MKIDEKNFSVITTGVAGNISEADNDSTAIVGRWNSQKELCKATSCLRPYIRFSNIWIPLHRMKISEPKKTVVTIE